jgi:16S rRNA (cytidine1402-2'-O)-methyltransferase
MPAAPPGTLYLVPVPLGEGGAAPALPPAVQNCVRSLRHFIVEHPKTARRFLKEIGTETPLQSLSMAVLNEHTSKEGIADLLQPLLDGQDVGLMSEAGCPAVADPGAPLVALAHQKGVTVRPLVGPSSILLALMASGLNGQRFAFHGYLPADKSGRVRRIAELEKESARHRQTQIFIETPYRNDVLLTDLLATLSPSARLCIASDLTQPAETVRTQAVSAWRKSVPDLDRRPTVFLLFA